MNLEVCSYFSFQGFFSASCTYFHFIASTAKQGFKIVFHKPNPVATKKLKCSLSIACSTNQQPQNPV